MMDQKAAKKITETSLSSSSKTVLFELVRARNSVLSRSIVSEYFGCYVIYDCNEEYLDKFKKLLNKDGFWCTVKINWKSEHVDIENM